MGEKLSAIFGQRKNRVIIAICFIVCIAAIIILVIHNKGEDSGNMEVESEVRAFATYDAAYEALAALKTSKYEQLSVEQFANQVEQAFSEQSFSLEDAIEIVEQKIEKEDENYDFIMYTLKATMTELDPDCKMPYELYDNEISFISLTGDQEKIHLCCTIAYNVDDRSKVTVEQRDGLIEVLFTEIENDMNRMLLSTMKENEVKEELESEVNECIESLDMTGIKVSVTVKEVKLLE